MEFTKNSNIDFQLEVVVIPVSDVHRAKSFYGGLGWRLDARLPGLEAWGIRLAKRSGLRKAKVAVARKLAVICTGCGSSAPNSNGRQRRLPINLHIGGLVEVSSQHLVAAF